VSVQLHCFDKRGEGARPPGKYYLGGRDWRNRCPLTRDVKSARQPRRGAVGGTHQRKLFSLFRKKTAFFGDLLPERKSDATFGEIQSDEPFQNKTASCYDIAQAR